MTHSDLCLDGVPTGPRAGWPVVRAWAAALLARRRQAAAARRLTRDLARLDDRTLRDIGAPAWMVDERRRDGERCRFQREIERLRGAGGLGC